MIPGGLVGPQWGKPFLPCVYIGKISLKIFFSRTIKPISIKLDTNHPCIKGIQVCAKYFFSRTTRPEKLRFT
jgi:hypothetical protein